MTECGNCGRHNQPTTRFCAECGDVLRTDPPRKHRLRSKKRGRRLGPRGHWIRVPPGEAPSVLTAKRVPSLRPVAHGGASDRMVRRIDLIFALIVCIVGFAAYLGFPYLKRTGSEMAQTTPAAGAPAASGIPETMGPADAAKALGVSEADVIASLEAGDLKGKKIGTQWRVTRAALAEFLK